VLVEEKARAILAKHDYYSSFKRLSKNTFRIGEICYVYLRLEEPKAILSAFVERKLLVRPSIKSHDKLKSLKVQRIEGEYYYEFDEFVKKVVLVAA
jgi:hypothetical protein